MLHAALTSASPWCPQATHRKTHIALADAGNALYLIYVLIYVLHLSPGPVWALHLFHTGKFRTGKFRTGKFHTASAAVVMVWYLRFVVFARDRPRSPVRSGTGPGEGVPPGRSAAAAP